MAADETAPENPVPMLRLGDREFRCVAHLGQWHTMKLAAGLMGNDVEALAAMHTFLTKLVDPEDWSAFDDFMGEADVSRDELDEAIGGALAEMAGRGKGSTGSSTPSSGGSPTPATSPTHRVVSLSQGTAEERNPLDDGLSSTG